LLGTLPDGELEAIDLRIIEDETFAADVALAESDLIEDFIEGSLSGDELRLLNENFLIGERRNQLLSELTLLKKIASRNASVIEPREMAAPRSFFQVYFRQLVFGAAVVLLVVAAFVVWQGRLFDSVSPVEREYAEMNKREINDLSAYSDKSTLNLTPANLRDGGSSASRKAEDMTGDVLLRLALPAGELKDKMFIVRLVKGSTQLFYLSDIRSYSNQSGREVRVVFPKSVLSPGQYQVRLLGTDGKTEYGSYPFSIR